MYLLLLLLLLQVDQFDFFYSMTATIYWQIFMFLYRHRHDYATWVYMHTNTFCESDKTSGGGQDRTGVALLNHSSFSTRGHDHDLPALSIMIKFPRHPSRIFPILGSGQQQEYLRLSILSPIVAGLPIDRRGNLIRRRCSAIALHLGNERVFLLSPAIPRRLNCNHSARLVMGTESRSFV